MPFKIKHPATGLAWEPVSDGRIRIRQNPHGARYEIDEAGHIQNLDTGLYVRHCALMIREDPLGTPAYDFEWTIEDSGRIYNKFDGGYYLVQDGDFLKIAKTSDAVSWYIAHEDDVPVSRAAALIEEALNASKKCGCECGCEAGCEGCACEGCDCPKPTPVETPVETTEA